MRESRRVTTITTFGVGYRIGEGEYMTQDGTSITGHGGEHALAAMAHFGVQELFTLSGAHVFPLYDAAVKASWPIWDVRHEQTATFAAEGLAKLTRRPGVAVAVDAGAYRYTAPEPWANALAGDRQRCLDAGMDDSRAKPVSRAQLEGCLHRWLPDRMNFVLRNAALVPPAEPAPPPPAVATARAPAPSFPVLDQTMLEELREIAGDETTRIITIFLEDAPRLIGTLEKAAAVPDLDAMRDAAHTLKSSSANVGAMALSAAAKRVELGARARKLERPAVAVALVIAEYARARMALQGYAAQQLGRPLLPVPPQARPPSPAQPAPATPQSSSLVNR